MAIKETHETQRLQSLEDIREALDIEGIEEAGVCDNT